jgi:hypothetical protein
VILKTKTTTNGEESDLVYLKNKNPKRCNNQMQQVNNVEAFVQIIVKRHLGTIG